MTAHGTASWERMHVQQSRVLIFFFQAEDGIRDVVVTGVQTCALPISRHGGPHGEIARLLHSVAVFPERAHLVGAYSLGEAQSVIALLRQAGHAAPIYLHGAMEKITAYYAERGVALGEFRIV